MSQAVSIDTTVASDWQRLRELRRQAEMTLEEMLDVLNRIDGDPDLEDGADDELTGDEEPSMGWTACADQRHLQTFHTFEADGGEYEEDDPGEPSLASPERHPNTFGTGLSY